ncbi:hypothetical protein L249_3528 [Ophiocordyceps polyrhachis-furcata BCC 54312]|uniref:C2H2-type domain-containing protein n=1 Tax=Ophiocordyceps polyrhachis-furcata BCC 54312 TaxID=1330021 RepID=A0A367LMK4_9HYPO|nr:hypothetical protein L249_3528 [Ophiocordyceps polyrhachis-furcata BCC 54312]
MSPVNPLRRTCSPGADDSSIRFPMPPMSLRQGTAFHSPPPSLITSSPEDDGFVPPAFRPCHIGLHDEPDAGSRVAILHDIGEKLSKLDNLFLKPKASTTIKPPPDESLLSPSSSPPLSAAGPDEPWFYGSRFAAPRPTYRARDQDSDSGLGSSVTSTADKCEAMDRPNPPASTFTWSKSQMLRPMMPRTCNRILERIVYPLLKRSDLQDFWPAVKEVPRLIKSKGIVCLRDVEKTLIFMAPVSRVSIVRVADSDPNLLAKGRAKTATLYLKFCMFSIRCIQATVEQLLDHEQIRPGDRPYNNGYFIDLKEQIHEYGRQLHAAREAGTSSDMNLDSNDEVKLFGGVAENGRPAELIRVRKDGTAISMATGKPVDTTMSSSQSKRSLAEQQEDEEEIMRSMARRKKNASLEELAPKRCSELGCHKVFKRPCDLTKHEKTHSRPWKCPVPTCKYHEFGWPTEKEMDRHVNDKHSNAPAMYECMYANCPYKSKRESNCKQHMEKAHGWHYVRSKTNGKKSPSKPASSVQQTPPLGSASTPSTTPAYSAPTPPQEQDLLSPDYSMFPAEANYGAAYGLQAADSGLIDLALNNSSPSTVSYEQYPPYQDGALFILSDEDIYAAQVQLPTQPQVVNQVYDKMVSQQFSICSGLQPSPSPQDQQQALLPHLAVGLPLSALTEASATLFSPDSLLEEGFDEPAKAEGSDFSLFPVDVKTENDYKSLFEGVPSANLGLSQNSQPDSIFGHMRQMNWAPAGYHTQFS